jgi:hypothetical protein
MPRKPAHPLPPGIERRVRFDLDGKLAGGGTLRHCAEVADLAIAPSVAAMALTTASVSGPRPWRFASQTGSL